MAEPNTPKIDLADVCVALSGEGGDLDWFLDLITGETVLLNGEYAPDEHGGLSPDQVRSTPERFTRIPTPRHGEMVQDMEAFAQATPDDRLRQSLELALSAPHPERRFRAVLGWIPEEQHRWRSFRHHCLERRARSWLSSLGLAA